MTNLSARYAQSNDMLNRAEKVIPLGSQTFSKSKVAYPANVAPMFITHGDGCQVWDVDGNQYTDFVSGLLSVSAALFCCPLRACCTDRNGKCVRWPGMILVTLHETMELCCMTWRGVNKYCSNDLDERQEQQSLPRHWGRGSYLLSVRCYWPSAPKIALRRCYAIGIDFISIADRYEYRFVTGRTCPCHL